MLETVSKGFKAARNKLKGRTEITPEVVDEALRDIRVSLLEAEKKALLAAGPDNSCGDYRSKPVPTSSLMPDIQRDRNPL